MGIYIRGMEMPKSCYYCPMKNDGYYLCKATRTYKELEDDCKECKPQWCPLIPVPEHEWISVKERLPEEKTYVLILSDTIAGKMEKVSFLYKDSESRNCWAALDEYGKNLFDWQPTHWMPLPEPPKGET